jgi:molybdate transport system substrate-binding protein
MAHGPRRTAAVVALVAVSVIGAAGSARADQASSRPTQPAQPSGTITVSAAASLTDVFPVIASAFMKRYPAVTVRFNFGGSPALVEQLLAGAPVDVLATASESTMWKAVNARRATPPLLFAKNTMAIATPPANPAGIRRLADLSRPGVLVATCAVAVPCGSSTRDLLAMNGVTLRPVTQELDVRAVLGKVMADEVDAGIVYLTDVRAAGARVSSVQIPASSNVTTTYPIATVIGGPNPVAARAFVTYVRFTPSAQGILRAYGFIRPW